MNEASHYLFELAKRLAPVYVTEPDARAIMVTGSVSEGESDSYSDVDLILYYEVLPSAKQLQAAREQNGGSESLWQMGDRSTGRFAEAYVVNGVECQFSHASIAAWEEDMAAVLERLDVTSPLQKALSGTLAGIPLHGEPLLRRWKDRAAAYPEALAEAMIEKYMNFMPLRGLQERLAARDAAIWQHQVIVETAQNLLGVLAGLNRVYYTTFQFKRMGRFIEGLQIAPNDLASRLEHVFRADTATAAATLDDLVRETVALVEVQMPQVDTSGVRQRLDWRPQCWEPVARSD